MSYKPTSFPGFDAAFDAKTVPASFGFSSAVVIPAGASIISTAGHVGTLDKDLKIQGDLKQQMMDSWKNVERALLEAGKYESAEAAWKSVYEITTYHIGGVANAYECNFEMATKHFGSHTRPAWTAVGVTDLAYEGQLVEIQVKAVAPA